MDVIRHLKALSIAIYFCLPTVEVSLVSQMLFKANVQFLEKFCELGGEVSLLNVRSVEACSFSCLTNNTCASVFYNDVNFLCVTSPNVINVDPEDAVCENVANMSYLIKNAMENVALWKPAAQDSTYYGARAAYGVDGNFDTFTISNMLWQVDLEEPTVIRRIVLSATSKHADNTLCATIDGVACGGCIYIASSVVTTTTFACDQGLTGQIVAVEKQSAAGFLNVHELEAFSF